MRGALLLLIVVATVLVLAGGVVLAADKTCTAGDCLGTRAGDTITGSASIDRIAGMEGSDIISGGASNDEIYGDEGNDTIEDGTANLDVDKMFGDEGNDLIDVQEGDTTQDIVNCGPGTRDRVFFDPGADSVSKNCERKNP